MGKHYVYDAPAGSTIDLQDGEGPRDASKPFEMDDETAERVRREVPEVREARGEELEGLHPEQAPEVRAEGVQERSRREGAAPANPASGSEQVA